MKGPKAQPQLQVHFLEEVALLVGVGLIGSGEPANGRTVRGTYLEVGCVLEVPIHGPKLIT